MNVRPIVLVGTSRSSELKQIFSGRLAQWRDKWSSPDVPLELDVLDPKPINTAESCGSLSLTSQNAANLGFDLIVEESGDERVRVVWRVTPELELKLFSFMCGLEHDGETGSSSEMISGIVRDLMRDLVTTLLEEQRSVVVDARGSEPAAYSKLDYEVLNPLRYFRLAINIGTVGINVWVPKSALAEYQPETLAPERTACLVSRRQSMSSERVRLDVLLGEAEITIGELRALKTGDVIGLDKHLEEPLCMEKQGEAPKFMGYLGSKDGRFGFLVDSIK